MSNKEELENDLDSFYWAAISAICHCFNHTTGSMPDDCDCQTREKIIESKTLLLKELKRLKNKYVKDGEFIG